MLSKLEIDWKQIDEIITRYGSEKESLLMIMQDISDLYHYVPPEVVPVLAEKLGVRKSHIFSVATFYKTISLVPRGRYIVHVCTGTACHVRGAEKVMDALKTDLKAQEGETTADGLFTLSVVADPVSNRKEQADRAKLLRNLARSLSELGPSKLLLENMPWHYWYDKKERMVSNVCSSIDDMIRFKDMVDGFTLDLCHGYLSKPEGDPEYCRQFMKTFGAFTKHIHASDAKAPDSEGLQIGDGEVDFSVLKGKVPPVLVEVWNGHADGGQGFRTGIQRLREMEKAW